MAVLGCEPSETAESGALPHGDPVFAAAERGYLRHRGCWGTLPHLGPGRGPGSHLSGQICWTQGVADAWPRGLWDSCQPACSLPVPLADALPTAPGSCPRSLTPWISGGGEINVPRAAAVSDLHLSLKTWMFMG